MSKSWKPNLKGTMFFVAGCLLANLHLVADERPNVLVIMTDDMGYSDLGC